MSDAAITTVMHDRELPQPPPILAEQGLAANQWGMLAFLASEAALFTTLIVVYLAYLKADQEGPTAAVLSLPLVMGTTICLLASSATVHVAVRSLDLDNRAAFVRWWLATIVLGILFLLGTAYEWRTLIVEHGLTISRNLFGSTYFTLVGFHALHLSA